jgi:hypothetical protein
MKARLMLALRVVNEQGEYEGTRNSATVVDIPIDGLPFWAPRTEEQARRWMNQGNIVSVVGIEWEPKDEGKAGG